MSLPNRADRIAAAQRQIEASRLQLRGHLNKKPVSALDAVAATARAALLPIAQRHPLGLVVGALLLGGLIAWGRPWRWLFQTSLVAGLWPGLLTRVLSELPIQSWMAIWAMATSGAEPAAPVTPAADPSSSPQASSPAGSNGAQP